MKAAPALILHVTGRDRPGVTATVTRVLSEEGALLIDIGQSALHGYLTLSAIVSVPPGSGALQKLLTALTPEGFRVELGALPEVTPESALPPPADSLCVTLLGDLSNGRALSAATKLMADASLNIREILNLSDGNVSGLEFIVDSPGALSDARLMSIRGDILALASQQGCDLAIQREDAFRYNKRLVCMDVDSTFIGIEVIDELAALAGARDKVSAITERAMRGEMDFTQALKERVQALAGLEVSRAKELLHRIPMTPGAERLVKVLKTLGYRIGLVSGGFDIIVDELKTRFSLDFAVSNQLEVRGDKFTGNVVGGIVDAHRKAQVLKDMAQAFRVRLEQTVAVGDGANDLLMLQSAGLGIAFQAKPKLQAAAHLSLNRSPLDSLLFLLGYKELDLKRLDA